MKLFADAGALPAPNVDNEPLSAEDLARAEADALTQPAVAGVVPAYLVDKWLELKNAKNAAEAAEAAHRRMIVDTFLPAGKEGSHTLPIDDGRKLGITVVINRTVDVATLENLREQLREKGISEESLIKRKPELIVGTYRKLSDEDRAFFEQVLTIREGTPQMEVRVPKARGSK